MLPLQAHKICAGCYINVIPGTMLEYSRDEQGKPTLAIYIRDGLAFRQVMEPQRLGETG